MAHSNKNYRSAAHGTRRHGMITMVTVIALLGLVVLIGFIGNAGHAVKEKLDVQNAADSAALESAQWMARGMNAITATNHMMGEATAIVATLHALGGPEAIYGQPDYPNPSKVLDQAIDGFRESAPIIVSMYSPAPISNADKKIVQTILKLTTPKTESKRKHRAFATIYDSKIRLKREIIKMLMVKSFANLGFAVPPPFGYGTALAAYAAHIYGSKELVGIGKEWIILEGFERFLTAGPTRSAVKQLDGAVNKHLMPLLAKHADFVAGNLGSNGKSSNQRKAGIINHVISQTLNEFPERFKAKAFVYPLPKEMRLPVEREPRPSLRKGKKLKGWGNESGLAGGIQPDFIQMMKTKRKLKEAKEDIEWEIFQQEEEIRKLNELLRNVHTMLNDPDITPDQKRRLRAERDAINEAKEVHQAEIDRLKRELKKLKIKERKYMESQKKLANLPTTTGNITTDVVTKNLVRKNMNQEEESQSQWLRATYPYVDALRSGLLKSMNEELSRSQAAKHYEKWTNRFAMIKSWEFRSGYRYRGQGTGAYWTKAEERLQMYVMQGAYTGGKSPPAKGQELWTKETDAAKHEAEDIFTVLGVAHRKFEPHYTEVVYPQPNRSGVTAFAQAIYYNANPQDPSSATAGYQAPIGWDTLNWSPDTPTPEWGGPPSEAEKPIWPWEIFKSAKAIGSAKVKLNWQAKLMPITQRRFQQAARSRDVLQVIGNREARATMLFVDRARVFDQMVTH